jgi:peptidoglycan/xylan/chitin deacetylase (PgdA/CDA1 family)
MATHLTIIAYHFVRNLNNTFFPFIKGITPKKFREQVLYLKKYYSFITALDLIDYIEIRRELPPNALMMTFDEGFIDHFQTVFPILDEMNIQGFFFINGKAVLEHKMMDVNAIKFILASTSNTDKLVNNVFDILNDLREKYSLRSNEYYYKLLAIKSRYDNKDTIFIKRLLQHQLDEKVRHIIVKKMFENYVTSDEKAFAKETYMNVSQIKSLIKNGMYVGSHGYDHHWLANLSKDEQEKDILESLKFLKTIGATTKNWIMCYPYGSFSNITIEIIKQNGCALALASKPGIAQYNNETKYSLPRLDTNDMPTISTAKPNKWTLQTIK